MKVGNVRGVGGSWGPGGFSEPQTHMYTCTCTYLCFSLVAGVCGHGSPAALHHLLACSLVLFAPRPRSSRNKLKSERYGGISAFSSNRDHPNCARLRLVSLVGGPEGAGSLCRLRKGERRLQTTPPPCTWWCARCLTNVFGVFCLFCFGHVCWHAGS